MSGSPDFSNPQLEIIKAATIAIQAKGNLKPFTTDTSVPVTLNVWTTVLSISGVGVLNKAVCETPSGVPNIRVTIDGNLVHWTKNLASLMAGLCQESDIVFNSANAGNMSTRKPVTGGVSARFNNGADTYPITNGVDGFNVLSYPIPFASSLLVEVMTTVTEAMLVCVQGGVA